MMAGGHIFRLLFLVGFCLQSVFMEQRRVLEQRKPFFERFRRLEEQVRIGHVVLLMLWKINMVSSGRKQFL